MYFCRCRVVFLRSFISALFVYFFRLHPYLKSSFTETFFPSIYGSLLVLVIAALVFTGPFLLEMNSSKNFLSLVVFVTIYGLNTCHYDQVLDLIAGRVLCMYLGCSLFTCLNGNDQVLFPSNYMLMAIFSGRLTYQPAMLCPLSNVITCQVLLQPLRMNSFVHAGMFITLIL